MTHLNSYGAIYVESLPEPWRTLTMLHMDTLIFNEDIFERDGPVAYLDEYSQFLCEFGLPNLTSGIH